MTAHSGQVLVAAQGGPIATGAVHIFSPSANGWAETGRIEPSAGEPGMGFGSWMTVSGDRMLVGANTETYVFEHSADGWMEVASFPAENPVYGGAIGSDWAVLTGTMGYDRVPPGPIRLLQRTVEGWVEAGTIEVPADAPDARFGASVAFVGEMLALGAPYGGGEEQEDGGYARGSGAVYFFAQGGMGWQQVGDPLTMPGALEDAAFGAGLAAISGAEGPHLFVSARGGGTGGRSPSVIEFVHDADEGWRPVNAFGAPVIGGAMRMAIGGPTVAAVGDEIWIGGLSGGPGGSGEILRYTATAEGQRVFAGTLAPATQASGGAFGGEISAEGAFAAVTSPGRDNGQGMVHVLEVAGDEWAEATEFFIETPNYEAINGTVACESGSSAAFGCADVDVLSFMPVRDLGADRGINVNDVWGWTDPETDREYALVGLTDQASFVDITNPEAPRYLGRMKIPEGANPSVWRDIKVYENHAFIVADGAGPHGMQVFDLTRLRDVGEPMEFEPDVHYTEIASAHNIVINEATGFAYTVGGRQGGITCGGGLHMIDIRDPKNPQFAGCFADEGTGRSGTGTSHDAQCVLYNGPDEDYVGREICLGSNETAISIADVTDKSNPIKVATAAYPNVAYAHQGWLTDDHRYFYLGDELDELAQLNAGNQFPGTRTLIWDLTDLDDPVLAGEYFGETDAIDHNMYTVGDLLYQSNYSNGLRILDISDPENPEEVAYFDTVPYEDGTDMGGSWSNYPYFRSGTILVTSGQQGLFMVRYRKPIT